eukprot:31498-Pelagococcus_subviridis.AAC.13
MLFAASAAATLYPSSGPNAPATPEEDSQLCAAAKPTTAPTAVAALPTANARVSRFVSSKTTRRSAPRSSSGVASATTSDWTAA